MNMYSYVVSRDYGFAPNPFFGVCTLATCKPVIRRRAEVGDWVIGTGSKRRKLEGYLIYAMRVGETLTFDEYWSDSRFRSKRPQLRGAVKQAYGDNIYHREQLGGAWCQEHSHHSRKGGCSDLSNVRNDTQTNRVLLSDWFVYFGKDAIQIPKLFRGEEDVCGKRYSRVHFSDEFKQAFIDWVYSLHRTGFQGEPMLFDRHLVKKPTRRQRAS